jgi:ketol-acid reductoisomerase
MGVLVVLGGHAQPAAGWPGCCSGLLCGIVVALTLIGYHHMVEQGLQLCYLLDLGVVGIFLWHVLPDILKAAGNKAVMFCVCSRAVFNVDA